MPYIRVYQPPKPKKPKTHPTTASVVGLLAFILATDITRIGYGIGDIATSFLVVWLMYWWAKLL